MAARPCDLCRRWQYDEETGNVYRDRKGRPVPRQGQTLCEVKAERLAMRPDADPDDGGKGCAKGHWRDEPDATPATEATIRLYELMRATSGACLTERERRDRWLAEAFRSLHEIDRLADEAKQNAELRKSEQLLAMIVANR